MPYKCVHCTALYEDGAPALLTGCSDCKSKFFFYIKQEKLDEIQKQQPEKKLSEQSAAELLAPLLSNDEKEQIEKDVREIAGMDEDSNTPVFLDFESVKVIKPGKYAVDLGNLFSVDKPRVYKLEDGKYIVDLSSVLKAKSERQS